MAAEYRLGHLDKPDLRRLLGFETGYEIDGFLKAHNVYEDYATEDFERERQALRNLGVLKTAGWRERAKLFRQA